MAQKNRDLTQPQQQTFRIDPPEEPTRWLRVKIYPITSDGAVTFIFGTGTDITAQKRYREEMEENQKRFQEIAQAVDGVFWLGDKHGNTLYYVSPQVERNWGGIARDPLRKAKRLVGCGD